MYRTLLAISISLGAFTGCDSDDNDTEVVLPTNGEAVFSTPLPDGNTFTCSTCHALSEPADDGFRRAGHTLAGATQRSTYKNGALTEMLDAVNSCRDEWMNADDPWTEENEQWLMLYEFLDAQNGNPEPISYEIVDPPAELGGGDVEAGRELFNESCAVCHARDGVGSQLAPPVAMRGLQGDLIARRVRTSGRSDSEVYDGLTGGIMPFWAADRLTDDELRDMIAWIESTGDPSDNNSGNNSTQRGCGVTHPMVGAVAELDTRSHNVSGTATIVDDCTIEITNFTFDGGGIEVRVYGGVGGNYNDGFGIGRDIVGDSFNNETLVVQLDESRSLDDLDGVSIWCVAVGIDFGSGMFTRP